MSDYILIKDYNPAYRYWIRAYLKQKKIMGEREYSWKEAQQISMDMSARGVDDVFFRDYFWSWRDHPEHPPDYFDLLRKALPISKDGKPDLAALAQLDLEARKRGQRVIFTIEDAAKDFHHFYDQFLTKPLARDLDVGTEGKMLMRYFEYEELAKLPDSRFHNQAKIGEESRHIAVELLQWLRTITLEKILDDIAQTIAQHYDRGLASANSEHSYNFKSKYVEVSAHRVPGSEKLVTTFLTPVRGYGVVKEGYAGVHFPLYYVEKSEL